MGLSGDVEQLIAAIQQLSSLLDPIVHVNQAIQRLLDDSFGMLLNMWFGFVLSTTDVGGGARPFTQNATIRAFEPTLQAIANAALVLAAMWASYRIMWGHGVRSQYTARVLLPRLMMGAVLINFAIPMFQASVDASNVLSGFVVERFGTIPADWGSWLRSLGVTPNEGVWPLLTSAALVLGYDVLAIAYVVRYTILVFLAITAPLAGLLFVVPDTIHLAKLWRKRFVTNLLMQPMQLFVLSIGFALERLHMVPVDHLFALVSLLVLVKVPGAMGAAEKAAHKLEEVMHTNVSHLQHTVAKGL
jgi:hypothetical protein